MRTEWEYDDDWNLWTNGNYEIWIEDNKFKVYLKFTFDSLAEFETLKDAKQFCEVHYATGA